MSEKPNERLLDIKRRADALGWETVPLQRPDGTVKDNAIGINSPDYCGSASLSGAEFLLSLYEAKAAGRIKTIRPGEDEYRCFRCNQMCEDSFYGCNLGLAVEDEGVCCWKPGPNCLGEGDYLLVKDGE